MSPDQPSPVFQPGVASPTYGPPAGYPPTSAYPVYGGQPPEPAPQYGPPPQYGAPQYGPPPQYGAPQYGPPPQYGPYGPVPPGGPARRGGSTALLWVLIAGFAVLLCGGAGVAGVLAYRTGGDDPGVAADPTRRSPVDPDPAPEQTQPPEVPPTTAPNPGAGGVITYEVTGDGPAAITYLRDDASGAQRVTDAKLPWRVEVPVAETSYLVSVIASRTGTSEGTLTCRVLVDGQEVLTKTNDGRFATVVCMKLIFD
jgi:hypothetical protein